MRIPTLSCVLSYFNWRRAHEELEVSDWGIRRTFGARPDEKNVEAVSWDALSKVEIRTTNSGPWSEDMFFVLHGADGKGALVSNDLAVKHQLVKALQERLPGLDDRAIIEASGCTSNKLFLIWQKP